MTTIDDFFTDSTKTTSKFRHPLLDKLQGAIQAGKSYQVEIHRPESLIGLVGTRIYVFHLHLSGVQPIIAEDWNEELNAGLVELGVRAKDSDNEKLRFAFGLRDALLRVERNVGNGYFNAVLLDLVKETKLDRFPAINDVLKHTYHNNVEKTDRYFACRESIATQISGRARELTINLGYTKDEAKEILSNAIAEYIDHRFSVSSRRQFGLL